MRKSMSSKKSGPAMAGKAGVCATALCMNKKYSYLLMFTYVPLQSIVDEFYELVPVNT